MSSRLLYSELSSAISDYCQCHLYSRCAALYYGLGQWWDTIRERIQLGTKLPRCGGLNNLVYCSFSGPVYMQLWSRILHLYYFPFLWQVFGCLYYFPSLWLVFGCLYYFPLTDLWLPIISFWFFTSLSRLVFGSFITIICSLIPSGIFPYPGS